MARRLSKGSASLFDVFAVPPSDRNPSDRKPSDRYRSVRRSALALAIVTLILSVLPEFLGIGATGLGPLQLALLLIAGGFILLGIGIGRFDGRWLSLCLSAIVAITGVCLFAGVGELEIGWTLWRLKNLTSDAPRLEIFRADPVLGWRHREASSAVDRHYDYAATYTIDAEGHRSHRSAVETIPADAQRSVLCLGGSFTFGQGVEDDQPYPAQLERLLPPGARVINAGVNGWGTVQCLLYLREVLSRSERPDVVTYGWIPAHADRNANRGTWLGVAGGSERQKPVVTVEDGEVDFDTLVGPAAGVPASDALAAEEATVTLACLEAMDAECRAADAVFICLLLGDDRTEHTASAVTNAWLQQELRSRQIRTLDLTDVAGGRYPHDGHPTAAWHRRIAERLCEVPPFDSWKTAAANSAH